MTSDGIVYDFSERMMLSRLTFTSPCLSFFIAVVLLLAVPACADLQPGVDAYQRGDYAMAVREIRPLAEQGDAAAQNNLGVMFDKGRGVPQDDQEAAKWYRLAADQGAAAAQYNLGMMYLHGRGVPQSEIQAYKWVTLAAVQKDEDAVKMQNLLNREMTLPQIDEAQRLAMEWSRRNRNESIFKFLPFEIETR